MKSRLLRTLGIVVLVFVLSLAGLSALRLSQREAQFRAVDRGISLLLDVEASALNDGYFSWSAVRDSVASGDVSAAYALLEDIFGVYPFVESVSIEPGTPPEEAFLIQGAGSKVNTLFAFKDDFGYEPLPGWVARVTTDAQALVDALGSDRPIVIDPVNGHEMAYSLFADFASPLFDPTDYLLLFLVTALTASPLALWFWRRSVFFYESKGLESIIFLFEQNEVMSANHSRRVAALALFLGSQMGYRGKALRDLYTAALLHDIGKISIPVTILQKGGSLTVEEHQAVMAHPLISARILKNFRELAHLSRAVLYHHERLDGSGYPEGLSGESIPIEARIIAVVDVFEALVGDRPYKDPLGAPEAIDMLRSLPLDAKVVETLASCWKNFSSFKAPRWIVPYGRMTVFENA